MNSIFRVVAENYILINTENNNSIVMCGEQETMEEQAAKLNAQYQTKAYVVKPYPKEEKFQ